MPWRWTMRFVPHCSGWNPFADPGLADEPARQGGSAETHPGLKVRVPRLACPTEPFPGNTGCRANRQSCQIMVFCRTGQGPIFLSTVSGHDARTVGQSTRGRGDLCHKVDRRPENTETSGIPIPCTALARLDPPAVAPVNAHLKIFCRDPGSLFLVRAGASRWQTSRRTGTPLSVV